MIKEKLCKEIFIFARTGVKGPNVRSYASGYTHLCPNCQDGVCSDGIKVGTQVLYTCEECSYKFIAKVGKYRNIPGAIRLRFAKVRI